MALYRLWALLHLWRHKKLPGCRICLWVSRRTPREWEEGRAGKISGAKGHHYPPYKSQAIPLVYPQFEPGYPFPSLKSWALGVSCVT